MKKIISLVICILMIATVLAGCNDRLGTNESGASISMYLASQPQSLDPAFVQLNHDVDQLLGLLFEPLTKIDSNGKVVPCAAESWTYKYDKRDGAYVMEFTLRSDMYWSDGRMVDAQDFVYAWKRILDPLTDSPYASMLYPIRNALKVKTGELSSDSLGLYATNYDTLTVFFEQEYNMDMFLETVSSIHLCPINEINVTKALKQEEEIYQNWANQASMACNGPFKVSSFEDGKELVLERNTYYNGREVDDKLNKYVNPYKIVITYQGGDPTYDGEMTMLDYQASRYESESIFYLGGFTKESYAKYKSKLETTETLNSYVYFFNTQSITDAGSRRAMSLALDRSHIVNEITGTGEIAATGYVPSGVFDTDRKSDFREVGGSLYSTSADMNAAKDIVGKTGSITLTYLIPYTSSTERTSGLIATNTYEDIAEYAKGVWEELGFSVTLRGLRPDAFTTALETRDFDVIGLNNIIGSVDAAAYLACFSKTYSGTKQEEDYVDNTATLFPLHYTNLDSAEYDELMTRIIYNGNRSDRASLLHEAEKMLVEELCPATALFTYTDSYIKSSKLKNMSVDYYGMKNFTDLKLKGYKKINEKEASILAQYENE